VGSVDLPRKNEVKYLGMHLDRRLILAKHIKSKRKQLNLKTKQMQWLLGRSKLSIESKHLLYKAVLKPIGTYAIQLWETVSNSKIENLQRFQSKTLLFTLNAPLYINSHKIHADKQMNRVLSEIKMWDTENLRKLGNN
jgi:hypothetical protein